MGRLKVLIIGLVGLLALSGTIALAAATSANIDQCANGKAGTPALVCGVAAGTWQNGNLNENNSQYAEGDTVPFRTTITVASAGTWSVDINYDATNGGKHAYDYLRSYNSTPPATNSTANPCQGITGCSGAPSTSPIPPDPLLCSGPTGTACASGPCAQFIGKTQQPGVMSMFNASITSVTYPSTQLSIAQPTSCQGTSNQRTVRVTFTVTPAQAAGNIVLAWGGHIGTQDDWGIGNSAVAISGSPYHMRVLQFIDPNGAVTSIGNQDRSLKASAVLVAPTLTTQANSSSISLGQSVTDVATLTSARGATPGTVAFFVCGPSGSPTACTTGGTAVGSAVTVNTNSGGGTATSAAFTPTAAGTYCFRAEYTPASGSGFLPTTHTDATSECFTVVAPNLDLGKTADAATVAAGSPIGFTITLSNGAGAGTASGLTISDPLPGGTGVTWSVAGTSTTPPGLTFTCAITGAVPTQTLNCGGSTSTTAFSLAASQSVSVHVTSPTTLASCKAYPNTATVNGPSPALTAQASTTVQCPNTPTIATTLSASSITVGGTIHDSATLSGATATAGGTVTYTVYTNNTCTTGAQSAGTKTVTNGVVPDSDPITFNSAGTFYWQAVYSGDAHNTGATSTCTSEVVTVGKASPTIATTLSASTGAIGDTVHDSSTLTGATSTAGGSVTYTVYTDNACSQGAQSAGTKTVTNGVVPDSNGIQFNSAGTFYWQAVYSGDANNNGASSVCTSEVLTVGKNSPTIATTLSASTANIGDTVHDSSTLSGATSAAGGTVTYSVYSDNACTTLVSGAGTKTVTNHLVPDSDGVQFNNAGTFYWQAVYSGDANNNGASSVCTSEVLTINPNAPSLSTTPSAGGTTPLSVHDSATLTGATANAGGSVTYKLFSNAGCTTQVGSDSVVTVTNGVVPDSAVFGPLGAGTYYWTAHYSGDTNNAAADSACGLETVVVGKVQGILVSTTLSATSVTAGTAVHDSATLTGATANAGGTVTYSVYTDNTCQTLYVNHQPTGNPVAVSNGVVGNSGNVTFDTAGTFYWQAVYSGDANNTGPVSSACVTEALTVTTAGQGCTPGYWKNHTATWPSPYHPGDALSTVFTFTSSPSPIKALGNDSLLTALNYAGGSSLAESAQILLRAGTSAVLSSAALSGTYPLTTAQIISSVNNELANGNRNSILALAAQLDADNNLPCPLN